MDITDQFLRLAISLGVGLLVGLERESRENPVAGLRTFALVALLGSLCASVPGAAGWMVGGGFVALGAVLLHGQRLNATPEAGITTEVAVLGTFAVGAYAMAGPVAVTIAAGATMAALLHFKATLHGWVDRLGDSDLRAIMRFVVVALVIFPALPDRVFGPYGVWNAREVWFMVVLITGLNLLGYLVFQFVGPRAGVLAAGLLGGAVSSTATTIAAARRVREEASESGRESVIVLLASAVVFGRLMAEAGVVSPALVRVAWLPLATTGGAMVLGALFAWRSSSRRAPAEMRPPNPSELGTALLFAATYSVVVLAARATRDYFGTSGLYAVAALSGLGDVDAITLSTANLVERGELGTDTGWRVLLVAAAANLAFKFGVVALTGARRFVGPVAVGFGAAAAVAGLWMALA